MNQTPACSDYTRRGNALWSENGDDEDGWPRGPVSSHRCGGCLRDRLERVRIARAGHGYGHRPTVPQDAAQREQAGVRLLGHCRCQLFANSIPSVRGVSLESSLLVASTAQDSLGVSPVEASSLTCRVEGMMAVKRALLGLAARSMAAWSQKPSIYPGGVVNAASFAAGNAQTGTGPALAGGSIASIFGTNIAD